MNTNDLELLNAATDQNVHLTKIGDDSWEVGMMPNLEPLTIETARQATTYLSGNRIRLPDGREFTRLMTTTEARREFGLEEVSGAADE